jgi:hypothetical protein
VGACGSGALADVRARELRALTDDEALAITEQLLALVDPKDIPPARLVSSGLVELQRVLQRSAPVNPLSAAALEIQLLLSRAGVAFVRDWRSRRPALGRAAADPGRRLHRLMERSSAWRPSCEKAVSTLVCALGPAAQ